jgi:hypothetical protein
MVWAVSLSTMKLIPHCLTATLICLAIRSLIRFSNPVRPLAFSVLYLQNRTRNAAPKCISRRTSYLRVRLAFHPYPQLIRAIFNLHRCGPPLGLTRASTWPWVDHTVSGLIPATKGRPIQTRFRYASVSEILKLTLPKLTRQLILQKARGHPHRGLPLLVGVMVSGTFNSPPGVLFTFPSRY